MNTDLERGPGSGNGGYRAKQLLGELPNELPPDSARLGQAFARGEADPIVANPQAQLAVGSQRGYRDGSRAPI